MGAMGTTGITHAFARTDERTRETLWFSIDHTSIGHVTSLTVSLVWPIIHKSLLFKGYWLTVVPIECRSESDSGLTLFFTHFWNYLEWSLIGQNDSQIKRNLKFFLIQCIDSVLLKSASVPNIESNPFEPLKEPIYLVFEWAYRLWHYTSHVMFFSYLFISAQIHMHSPLECHFSVSLSHTNLCYNDSTVSPMWGQRTAQHKQWQRTGIRFNWVRVMEQ